MNEDYFRYLTILRKLYITIVQKLDKSKKTECNTNEGFPLKQN